jgi:REP element-mobilizing transposase RayT
MSYYYRVLCHIVFRTKENRKSLPRENIALLYGFINDFTEKKHGHLFCINAIDDHVHLLCEIPPDISLADYIRQVKGASTVWLGQTKKFPAFDDWANGYIALSCGWKEHETVVKYINNQQAYHKRHNLTEELRALLVEQEVEIDEGFFP